jgi:GNAT superfamily N-acetyltransferase
MWADPLASFDRVREELWFRVWAIESGVSPADVMSVSVAMEVFRSVFSAQDNDLPLPEPDEPPIGRHVVNVFAADGDDHLLFRHGWSNWPADFAVGRLSREYFDRYATEVWSTRRCDRGPRAATIETMTASPGTDKFRDLWLTGGRRGTETLDKGRLLAWWETYSLQDQADAEVVALVRRNGVRVREAVALVEYAGREAIIADLFVWPPFRRQGLGTLLERHVAQRARQRGAESLRCVVYDADTVHANTVQIAFLRSRTYEISEYPDRQVRIEASRPL